MALAFLQPKEIDMIIYFAGDGKKEEDDVFLHNMNDTTHWGVLLSYKTIKTLKGNKGSLRFQRLMHRMGNVHPTLKKVRKRREQNVTQTIRRRRKK